MPTAPGFADVSVEISLTGFPRPSYVTFGVDPTSTDPAEVASKVHTAWTFAGSINTMVDSQAQTTGVLVSLGTDGGGDLVYRANYTTVGGGAKSSLPPNCALLIHKNTGRGGRRGRGRMFLPWSVEEGLIDEMGIIPAATVNANNTALQVFLTQLGVQQVPMVLLHGAGKTSTPAPDVVLTLISDRLIATQRRRLGR